MKVLDFVHSALPRCVPCGDHGIRYIDETGEEIDGEDTDLLLGREAVKFKYGKTITITLKGATP